MCARRELVLYVCSLQFCLRKYFTISYGPYAYVFYLHAHTSKIVWSFALLYADIELLGVDS
jgi:hypothetical protein